MSNYQSHGRDEDIPHADMRVADRSTKSDILVDTESSIVADLDGMKNFKDQLNEYDVPIILISSTHSCL